ncbi:MAG TPA: WD40 repeat domain-containing protein [Bacteroidales bacterium]|nr:WD40 repeat domain-containing protein [Bacteroidales bacterium]
MRGLFFVLLMVFCLPITSQNIDYIVHRLDYREGVTAVSVSPDDRWLLAGFENGAIRVFDIASMEEQFEIKEAGTEAVFDIEMTPKMDVIFVASGNRIALYDTLGTMINQWSHHRNTIWSMDISPDGKWVASTETNRTFHLTEVYQGTATPMRAHEDITLAVEFSSDGKMVASGSNDKTVLLWDVASQEVTQTLRGISDVIYDVSLSPNDSLVAACSKDGTVRVWNISDKKLKYLLDGHQDRVFEIEFSPDGKYLLSGSADMGIKLWDMRTGEQLYAYLENESSIADLVFLPGGSAFASAGMDGNLTVWGIDPEIFVMKYFSEEYDEALEDPVFEPRRKGERRSDFKERKMRAKGEKEKIIEGLFERYKEEVEGGLCD